ncbi:hypothetical protein F4776DRAFT_664523 [Hypoxylon sp. NC0597]|nr:hypothetical protein F4776DRAFT_664523 [Hypoxylon sp. NC0597]
MAESWKSIFTTPQNEELLRKERHRENLCDNNFDSSVIPSIAFFDDTDSFASVPNEATFVSLGPLDSFPGPSTPLAGKAASNPFEGCLNHYTPNNDISNDNTESVQSDTFVSQFGDHREPSDYSYSTGLSSKNEEEKIHHYKPTSPGDQLKKPDVSPVNTHPQQLCNVGNNVARDRERNRKAATK